MTLATRLSAAEHHRTPKEIVLAWMREAHAYHSYLAYWTDLRGQPDEDYPLFRLPRENGDAVRARLKGRSQPEIDAEIGRTQKSLLFLFHLHSQVNEGLLTDLGELRKQIALVWSVLHELLFETQVSDHYLFLSQRLDEAWPYPLEEETAQAVAAAETGGVETWRAVEEGAITQGWLEAQLIGEGRTQLPWAAGLARGDIAPRPLFPLPTLEEIRPFFKDEETYQTFLSASDYNSGFADVTDHDYEERWDAVETALRDLVRTGAVKEGAVLHLETVPHEFLSDAPLFEGEWIDRHVLLLAEWGALLKKRGYRRETSADNHVLAYSPILDKSGKEVTPGDERLEQRRAEAEAHLATCPAKIETIDGRPYLFLPDYLAWKGRLVKGALTKDIRTGLVRESFNEWVRRQQGKAELAGVPVKEIEPWTAGFPREAVPAFKLAERLAARREVILEMNRFLTFDAMVHPKTEASLKHTERFRRRARQWAQLHEEARAEIASYPDAEELLSRRYFSGEPVYFPGTKEELDDLLADLAQMEELYREGVEPELTRGPESRAEATEAQDATAGQVQEKQGGSMNAGRYASHLVVLARAETLDNLGRKNEGIRLVEEWLEETGL